ncbi:YkvA family protein [Ancylobacter mangrovi]|uniref:YkvA family protein n=1 Tax=Ancylobacter mangrovi TaxID=2972472 RepID=A0A9X2T5J3_9HYPH|nr:YkvA family protein [Ancylobacter mangrovi]MCS0497346.1 YkvA family protein [Ancylobacter mangrovi]MCS0504103.1 YkvA family protein [Ancylobacter mangrovi]
MATPFDETFDFDAATGDAEDNERKVRAGFWKKLGSGASRLPFAEEATAAYYCALDSATPTRVRVLLFGALAYFLLPTDAVPDLFPVLGFTDDAAVIAATLNMLAGHVTPAHREAARAALDRIRAR